MCLGHFLTEGAWGGPVATSFPRGVLPKKKNPGAPSAYRTGQINLLGTVAPYHIKELKVGVLAPGERPTPPGNRRGGIARPPKVPPVGVFASSLGLSPVPITGSPVMRNNFPSQRGLRPLKLWGGTVSVVAKNPVSMHAHWY